MEEEFILFDDGTKFCKKLHREGEEDILEGPKGKTMSLKRFLSQWYNTDTSTRGKRKRK